MSQQGPSTAKRRERRVVSFRLGAAALTITAGAALIGFELRSQSNPVVRGDRDPRSAERALG